MSIQVLQDGERNLVLHVVDEGSPFTIDISTFSPNTRFGLPTSIRLDEVKYSTDADLELEWDATVNDNLVTLTPSEFNFNWRRQGGLNNPKSAGFMAGLRLQQRPQLLVSNFRAYANGVKRHACGFI